MTDTHATDAERLREEIAAFLKLRDESLSPGEADDDERRGSADAIIAAATLITSLSARLAEAERARDEALDAICTGTAPSQEDQDRAFAVLARASARTAAPATATRREVTDCAEALARLQAGDAIVYSQDGDLGWFVGGDRAFVSDGVVFTLRRKGQIKRVIVGDEDENYRGGGERDVFAGAAPATTTGGGEDATV